MVNEDYIFNIPRVHIMALEASVFKNASDVWSKTVEEIGEFLQAYSKYSDVPTTKIVLDDPCSKREHLIEEMTHVLVCFGMIAIREGISQEEINEQVQKKALDGVKYPFDVSKHIPIDQVMKDLKNCSITRNPGQIDLENNCFTCKTGNFRNVTVTCQSLLEDALYYLQQAYGKTEGPG